MGMVVAVQMMSVLPTCGRHTFCEAAEMNLADVKVGFHDSA